MPLHIPCLILRRNFSHLFSRNLFHQAVFRGYGTNHRGTDEETSGMTNQAECVTEGNGATVDFFDCITEIAKANMDRNLKPGKLFDYNSDHLQVAGAMAIKARDIALGISNSEWQDLYEEFQNKTGLFLNSTFRAPSPKNPRLAGGMQWTGDDYMAFLSAVYNNQILSALTMPGETAPYRVQQYQDQMATVDIGNSPAKSSIHEDWHYGFGNWLECHSKNFDCGPGSGKEVSAWASPGSLGSYPFIDRGHKFRSIIVREDDLASFSEGYAIYMSVSDLVNRWATKNCSKSMQVPPLPGQGMPYPGPTKPKDVFY